MATKPANRRGPRADRQTLKADILVAARKVFAESGYQAATIKAIATEAEVDTKLIHYYFGSKAELFNYCIDEIFQSMGFIDYLKDALETGNTGEIYVRVILESIENNYFGPALLSLLRSIGTHEESRQLFNDFIVRNIVQKVIQQSPDPGLAIKLPLVGSQMLGLVIARYILEVPTIKMLSVDQLAQLVGPTIDRYLSLEF